MVNTPEQAINTQKHEYNILNWKLYNYQMSKNIIKKTRKIYFDQHKTFFKHNELFNNFISML